MNTTTCYIEVPVSERLPEKEGRYTVLFDDTGYIDSAIFKNGMWIGGGYATVTAWLEKKEIPVGGYSREQDEKIKNILTQVRRFRGLNLSDVDKIIEVASKLEIMIVDYDAKTPRT